MTKTGEKFRSRVKKNGIHFERSKKVGMNRKLSIASEYKHFLKLFNFFYPQLKHYYKWIVVAFFLSFFFSMHINILMCGNEQTKTKWIKRQMNCEGKGERDTRGKKGGRRSFNVWTKENRTEKLPRLRHELLIMECAKVSTRCSFYFQTFECVGNSAKLMTTPHHNKIKLVSTSMYI